LLKVKEDGSELALFTGSAAKLIKAENGRRAQGKVDRTDHRNWGRCRAGGSTNSLLNDYEAELGIEVIQLPADELGDVS